MELTLWSVFTNPEPRIPALIPEKHKKVVSYTESIRRRVSIATSGALRDR